MCTVTNKKKRMSSHKALSHCKSEGCIKVVARLASAQQQVSGHYGGDSQVVQVTASLQHLSCISDWGFYLIFLEKPVGLTEFLYNQDFGIARC